MSLSKNSLILFVSCLTFAMTADGFLLNPGLTSSPGITSQYISMDMYLAEKKELRNQIFQFQRENEQTLQLLTTQLQQKLSVMDDKLQQSSKPNDTIEFVHLEQKNRDLEVNLTILQEKHRLLQINYVRQKDQLDLLKNTSTEVKKELSELKQLKIVNQTLDLHVVQGKIQSLEQKTNLLTNNQNARSQDFLALYNVTRVTDNHVNQIGKQLANQFSSNTRLNATIGKNYGDLITRFNEVETKLNTSFGEVISKINTLQGRVFNNSQKVGFTACGSSSASYSGTAVKFPMVFTQVGINNISAFKSNGKFVCEIPGLYYISAHIRTTTADTAFFVFKNNEQISISASGSYTITDVPISAVVELQTGDQLYVKVYHYVAAADSCVTIAKINNFFNGI